MAVVSGFAANFLGVFHPSRPKVLPQYLGCRARLNNSNSLQLITGRIVGETNKTCPARRVGVIHAASPSSYDRLSFDDFSTEPFWISLIKETYWGLRSLFVFLAEQPSQLKYIEWPGFQSTVRTATLTLVLVALFIVALSSVDSSLCYILAWFLRKTP